MFSKKKGSTPPPAESMPSIAPQLGYQFQSLFAQEINPPLANVDFGFNRPYGEPAAPVNQMSQAAQPAPEAYAQPQYAEPPVTPDYAPPATPEPSFETPGFPEPMPLPPQQEESVVWGTNDQAPPVEAAMPAPAVEEPWQSAPPDMQPVPMTWPEEEPAEPAAPEFSASPSFGDFIQPSADFNQPSPDFNQPSASAEPFVPPMEDFQQPPPMAYAPPAIEPEPFTAPPPMEPMPSAGPGLEPSFTPETSPELHYSNPVLSPEEAEAFAQPVEPSFWENVSAPPSGDQMPIGPEASGEFLDSVSSQLYPEDPFSTSVGLDPMSLSEGAQAFEEASQFLFPETTSAPLDWDDPNAMAYDLPPAFEPPALELGPSYQMESPTEFDDISASLGPTLSEPLGSVEFPGSTTPDIPAATGAWDQPATTPLPEPDFSAPPTDVTATAWEPPPIHMPDIASETADPLTSWTPVTEIGNPEATATWEMPGDPADDFMTSAAAGPHPYADDFDSPATETPGWDASFDVPGTSAMPERYGAPENFGALDLGANDFASDFGTTPETATNWNEEAPVYLLDEADDAPVYDLGAPGETAPAAWDASPSVTPPASTYSSSLEELAAAAASAPQAWEQPGAAPASDDDFNSYPADDFHTAGEQGFGTDDDEDGDVPVYSLDDMSMTPGQGGYPQSGAAQTEPVRTPTDNFGPSPPMPPASEPVTAAHWDSWATPAQTLAPEPQAQDAFTSAGPAPQMVAMPQPDANLMDPSQWQLDKLEVLQTCQMDTDKHLFLVRNGSLYALMGQAGNPQNPGISVVKVFQGNPLHADPSFGASKQAGMGDQQMYVAQVGHWTAILSTLRDQIFLHTELS